MKREEYDRQLIKWVKDHYWDSLNKDKALILRHMRTWAAPHEKMDSLYEMKLHKTLGISNAEITRVPGGWIYTHFQINQVTMPDGTWSENCIPSSVFVRFDSEFM